MPKSATIPRPGFRPTPAERRTFAVRPELSLTEWTERHVRLVDGPLVEGGPAVPWSPSTFALQRAPMESLTDPRWSRTVLVTAPQAFGKTQTLAIPPLLYAVEYLHVTPFYVAANQDLSSGQWEKKVEPAIRANPDLAGLLHANPDFGGTKRLRHFTNGTSLHMVGAESVGKLSGHTSPVVICDDVQAYPESLPRFGHPADYAVTRSGALPAEQCIHAAIGTAGTVDDYLWRALVASAYFVPAVPCLRCGTYQLIEFDRLEFGDTPAAALDGPRGTQLKCVRPDCPGRMMYLELPKLLARHLWVSVPAGEDWISSPPAGGVIVDLDAVDVYPDTGRNTNIAGFWANALYWPYGRTWGEIAADWLVRRGNPDREKDFAQNTCVIPYREPRLDEDALEPADIAARVVESHAWQTVPAEAAAGDDGGVVISADVQAGYIWYLVCGWRKSVGTCWVVECGRFGSKGDAREFPARRDQKAAWRSRVAQALDGLWRKDTDGWRDDAGEVHQASLCLVDCGFLRDTVQTFCKRANGGRWGGKWLSVEGSQCRAGGRVPVWPGIRRPTIERKTRRRYWESNTNRAKLYVRDLLAIPPGSDGSLNLPADMPDYLRTTFAKHLCAEDWDQAKGRWVKVSGENHLLDAMALQIAGALALGVRLPSVVEQLQARPPAAGEDEARPSSGSGRWKIGR